MGGVRAEILVVGYDSASPSNAEQAAPVLSGRRLRLRAVLPLGTYPSDREAVNLA